MNYETEKDPFYKSLMAGLFAGIVITISTLIFNFIYRGITKFNPSEIVNVTSVIFFSLILSMVAALLYFAIVTVAGKSKILYIVIFIALTAFVTYTAFSATRSNDAHVSSLFQGLLAGVFIISGLVNALLIPYMAESDNAII